MEKHRDKSSSTDINEIRSILIGSDLEDMKSLLEHIDLGRQRQDEAVDRILRDFRTRIALLENKTNEVLNTLKAIQR